VRDTGRLGENLNLPSASRKPLIVPNIHGLVPPGHGKLSGGRAHCSGNTSSSELRVSTILLIILILLLVGALPSWPHSRSWGYGPSGLLGLVVVVLVILLLLGRI
jgi:hypothetical protein